MNMGAAVTNCGSNRRKPESFNFKLTVPLFNANLEGKAVFSTI